MHHCLSFARKIRTVSQPCFLLVTSALLLSGVARADEFTLKSGKVVHGAIVSQTDSQYVLQTEVGTIKIAKSDVIRSVSVGTSEAEIQGDIAQSKGDFAKARASFTQALQNAKSGSLESGRLQTKLDNLNSATQKIAENDITFKFQQASNMVSLGNYGTASTMLNDLESQVSASDPLSSGIHQLQAKVHYSKGLAALDAVKTSVAQEELEAAINTDPTFYPAYISLGESLLGNSATADRGVELLEQGLKTAGNRISESDKYKFQYRLAKKYYDQKMFPQAAAAFAALIPAREKYPVYADAIDRAVDSYVKMGEENFSSDFQQTVVNLNNALKLNPQNQKALFLLGRIYLDIGQLENSVVTLKRLVTMNPTYPEAQHYLGQAYFKTHNSEKAIEHLTAEITNNPGNYFALTDRAEAYIDSDNFTAAQVDLAAAKAIDADKWMAYYLDGLLAFDQKDYDKARTLTMEALDRKRTAVRAHLLMARILIAQNQVDGARTWLDQVATSLESVKNPSYVYKTFLATALTELGEISIKQNSPRQAENYLVKALKVLPDHVPAVVALADTKLLLANDAYVTASRDQLYKEAETLYLKAVAADQENADYFMKLGSFYRINMKNNDKAKENYNLYVDKGGRDSIVNTWLTEVGGTARSEIAVVPTIADSITTSGALVSTTTTTLTTGPQGAISAGLTPVNSGDFVLPVDQMVAETSASESITSAPVALPLPDQTPQNL